MDRRDVGGWNGPVFVVADEPSIKCFNHSRWDGCGLKADIIPVNTDTPHWTLPSLTQTKGVRLVAKTFKMRLFELVNDIDPSIDTILYADGDVLIGQPLCLKHFFDTYVPQLSASKRIFAFREEEEGTPLYDKKIHGGIWLSHREYSKPLMDAWLQSLLETGYASDQKAFVAAVESGAILEREIGWMDTHQYQTSPGDHCLPENNMGKRIDKCDGFSNTPLKCLVHVHNARCVKYGGKAVQEYIDRFGLCTMQDMPYCTPMYMSWAAMGWFPYDSCRKLELGHVFG